MIQENRNLASGADWPVDRPRITHNVRGLIRRHFFKSFCCFLLVMAAAVLVTSLSPKIYHSEGKLYVRVGRENAALDVTTTLGQSQQLNVPQSRENELNSIVEALRSRVLLEKVVDALGSEVVLDKRGRLPSQDGAVQEEDDSGLMAGLAKKYPGVAEKLTIVGEWLSGVGEKTQEGLTAINLTAPMTPREKAVRELYKSIGVSVVRKTDVILVDCSARSPQLAQAIVEELIDCYLQQHTELNRAPGAREFFSDQTELLRTAVTKSEEQLRDLKTATGLAAPDEQKHILVTQMGRMEDELHDIRARIAAGEAEVKALRAEQVSIARNIVTTETAGFGNEGTDGMRKEMFALQVKLEELVARYSAEHPLLMQLREQAAAAKKIVSQEAPTRQQITTALNPSYQQVELALVAQEPVLAAQRAKALSLESQLASVRGELKSLNENTLQIARLEREIDLQDASYRGYAENLERSRVAQALDEERMSNLRILQPPTLEFRPVRPNVIVNLGLGFLLALFAAFSVALASELRRNSPPPSHGVEQTLGVPVLGSIPRWKQSQTVAPRRAN